MCYGTGAYLPPYIRTSAETGDEASMEAGSLANISILYVELAPKKMTVP